MACDRLDIEFYATIEWKATPRRVLILMTQHSGICHFSKNSNYNMEECGQFVYVWCRQLREKNPRTVDTVHQVHELSLVFPVQKRPLQTQIPPTITSSHSVQPKNSSIPQSQSCSFFFPQPFRGGLHDFFPNSFFHCCFNHWAVLMEQLVLGCVSNGNPQC